MPELPEVETTINGLRPHVLNHVLRNVHIRESRLRWPIPTSISQQLTGQRVIDLKRRAKYLLFLLDRGGVISHLGMSGSWRVVTDLLPLRTHDHIVLTLDNGLELRYHDPRRFGCFIYSEQPEQHQLITSLGPEPLSDAFDGAYLFAKTRHKTAAIKTVLMNNHVVVGVGNIYAQEALFIAGIRPGIAASRLSRARCHDLAHIIKALLQKAITQGGTTLRDFVNSDGEPGYFAQQLHVYGRGGELCHQCGHIIKSISQSNRTTSYCPQCQT